jgi:hypothetical protein
MVEVRTMRAEAVRMPGLRRPDTVDSPWRSGALHDLRQHRKAVCQTQRRPLEGIAKALGIPRPGIP